MSDRTAHRIAKEAGTDGASSLETLVQDLPTGVVVLDGSGRVQFVNEEAASVFQRSRAEIEGAPLDLPVDGEGISEIIVPDPDGADRIVEVRARPTRWAGEEATLVTVLDITESPRLQELDRKTESLREANEELQRFAYIASHDLQEPLRTVASFVQLLQNRYEGQLDDEAHEFIEYAVDGVKQMRRLIRGLRAYSRLDTSVDPDEVDAEEALEDALAGIEAYWAETGAEVDVADLPTLQADRIQLSQLFQNLLLNAMENGGGERPTVRVSAHEADEHWVLVVADDGVGIPEQEQERVFEAFERGSEGEPAAPDGLGLGLAICQRIAARHGGRIEVDSSPGHGSRFLVYWPKEPDLGRPTAERVSIDRSQGQLSDQRSRAIG